MSTYVDRSSQETYDSHENDQARLLPDVKDLYRHDEEPKQQEKGVTQARSKQILSPKTFTLQGWICLALVIVTSFSSGFGLGSLLVKRCNEKECTKLLSGYCEFHCPPSLLPNYIAVTKAHANHDCLRSTRS